MPIYLGTKKLDEIYLGATGIEKVYLGTTLVFNKGSGPSPGPTGWTLFDRGWVSGFDWAGNMLPRPRYTSIASYNFSNVGTLGYMELTFDSEMGYSDVNHNAHVCTYSEIRVPATAVTMHVEAIASLADSYTYIKFGLLTRDCVNSCDATNGGLLSSWEVVLAASVEHPTREFMLDISNVDKTQNWLAVVNGRHTAQDSRHNNMLIYKVWFT